MFTKQAVFDIIIRFLRAMKADGFNPTRAVLFGSYAKGKPHRWSDIDLAVWDDRFSGCLAEDIELLHHAKRQVHPALEVHTFHTSETEETNPFIQEILSQGIPIEIPHD